MTKLAIIDLDGVVVNNAVRAHKAREAACKHVDNVSEFNDVFWATMFDPALVELDEPVFGSVEMLILLEEAGFAVLYLTSRPLTMRDATLLWLAKYGLMFGRDVIMKDFETDRYTRTDEWKAKQVHNIVTTCQPDFVFFVDDESKNRYKVQGLRLFNERSWLITDSLTNGVITALLSVPRKEGK